MKQTDYDDWVLKNVCHGDVFFSSRSNYRARGAYWVFKADVLFEKLLDMVPGGSGEWDRRSVSAAVRHRRRTCHVESDLGKGKNRPNTTYPNSKEEEKAILNAGIQIHERVREPNWGRRSIDQLLCACMHSLRAAAVHAGLVNSIELGTSNDSFLLVLQLKNGWAAQRTTNQRSERSKFGEGEACRVRWGKQQGLARTHLRRLSLPLPRGDEHSPVYPGHSQTSQSWERRIEGRLQWLQPFLGFGERPQEFADFRLFCVCFNGRKVGKALCGAKNPAERRTTPTTVKSTSNWAILPN